MVIRGKFNHRRRMKIMKKKLLFGNNISNIGKLISKNFGYFNFQVSYCGNSYSNIMDNLHKCDYDGLFFFAISDNDELYSFIRNVRQKFPDIKIYPIIYNNMEIIKEKLFMCDVQKCFTLPITSETLCFSIIHDFFSDEDILVSIDIADFLIKSGFPNHVKGFYLFCLCIEMVIDKPELFTNFSKLLYPAVREKTGSSVAWIERSIRNLSRMIYKLGIRFENYPDDCRLTNKTFVKAVADNYCKVNNIKRRRF